MELLLDFKEGPDPVFVSRTQIILIRTKGVTAYLPVATEVTAVETLYNGFLTAMSNAMNGGTEEITIRNEKRTLLENGLEKLGNEIIVNSGGNPLYVTNANFKLRYNDSDKSRQPLADPLWKNLKRGVLSGTLQGSVRNFPKGAVGLIVEYRVAGSTTFIVYGQTTGKRVYLEGLPTNVKVEVQVRFYGTFLRRSNWSIPFPIDVT